MTIKYFHAFRGSVFLLVISVVVEFGVADEDIEYLDDDEIFGRRKSTDKDEPDPVAYRRVECGDAYDVSDEGFIKFKLPPNSPEECKLSFHGSIRRGCTSNIFCQGIDSPAPTDSGECSTGYLEITDAIGGEYKQCGSITFDNPLMSTLGGKDLFVNFKGISSNESSHGFCLVICGEDRPNFHDIRDRVPKELPFISNPVERIDGCVCGIKSMPDARIVGGVDAQPFEFPWLAAIVHTEEEPTNRKAFCGASLISDRHILTAAHCFASNHFDAEDFSILLHVHILDKNLRRTDDDDKTDELNKQAEKIPGWELGTLTDEDENTLRLKINKIDNHPLFNSRWFWNDVSVLHLSEPLNLTDTELYTPLCLPPRGVYRQYDSHTQFEVAGWGFIEEGGAGASRILQKLSVPFINTDDCTAVSKQLHSSHNCAGDLAKGGKDACQGDSGGPAFVRVDEDHNQYMQSGIVSSGVGCARVGFPGLYTNIEEIIQWIYHSTGDAKWCLDTEVNN